MTRPTAELPHGSAPDRWTPDRVYAGYFVAQAAVGVALWVALATSPRVADWIDLLPSHPSVTDSFFLADLFVGVLGSALSAVALGRGARWAFPVVAFTAGGMVYPTIYLMNYLALTGVGRNVLAIMIPPSTLTCWITFQLFRAARRNV